MLRELGAGQASYGRKGRCGGQDVGGLAVMKPVVGTSCP